MRFIDFCGFCVQKISFLRFLFDGLCEEAEIHFAVMPLFHEVGMFLEALVFVVL